MSENDEVVSVPKAQYDEMVEKIANGTQNESNLVAEIKELREKKQLSEQEAESLKKQLADKSIVDVKEITPETIKSTVENVLAASLAARDADAAKSASKNALTAFIGRHKEFHPDNDPGGLKMAALERKLSVFNTSGLKTESEFSQVFEDAARLVNNTVAPKEQTVTPNPFPPTGGGGADPAEVNTDKNLSPKELRIIDRSFGGDKERYLKIREKRPDYVATLLQYSV